MILYMNVLIVAIFYVAKVGSHSRVRRIVGGVPAEAPAADEPIVYVRFSGKTAKITGLREFPHYMFRGIRFADEPVGKYRFQRPRQHFLQGDIDATKFPPPCLQPVPHSDDTVGDEDCLFLNIFTPDLPDGTEGLPVVVWIHGGGFRYGSASQYGVRHLVGKKLVVVTIQYRLGSLGFLSTGTQDMPGNVGIWDMALAVQWVRNYIGFFGGNPHKIVVMGHGSGASSAVLMALSNIAKGMTSAVVAMSGTGLSNGAIENSPTTTASEVAEQQGCPNANVVTMVKCLQKIPAKNIIEADSQIEKQRLKSGGMVSGLSGTLGHMPIAEGRNDGRSLPPVIEMKPVDELTEGKGPNIPILTGITRDETKRAVHGYYKNELLSALSSIPNFINKVLVENLNNVVGLKTVGNIRNRTLNILGTVADPIGLSNIGKNASNYVQQLERIAEVTGDALFNLPAFLTVHLWSKNNAPAYLYRFDHAGKARKGNFFLDGLPIVYDNETDENSNNIVAHGDDLSYIFDAQYLNGTSPTENMQFTNEDAAVRETYTQMIADFVRDGNVHLGQELVPQFSFAENNFIQIGLQPTLSKKFRFCEMAMWASFVDRLQTSTCKVLSDLKSVKLPVASDAISLDNLKNKNVKVPQLGALSKKTGGNSKPFDILG